VEFPQLGDDNNTICGYIDFFPQPRPNVPSRAQYWWVCYRSANPLVYSAPFNQGYCSFVTSPDTSKDIALAVPPVGGSQDGLPDGVDAVDTASRAMNDYFAYIGYGGARTVDTINRDRALVSLPPLDPVAMIDPVTTPASQVLALPISATGDSTIRCFWSVPDPEGISGYDVEVSVDGGPFERVDVPDTSKKSIRHKVTPGHRYRYRVAAIDSLGNVSNYVQGRAVKVNIFEESASQVVDVGTWSDQALASASGGGVQYATTFGARAKFTFTGQSVSWFAIRGPNRGQAAVWLDGKRVATVDLYSPTWKMRQSVFSMNGLENTSHQLSIRVLGTKNAVSSGARVDIDAFIVLR
jgi:hypothetical protein